MEEKYSVSELARLFGISTQTLRYYDKIDLFKPAYVDKQTGYRSYSYKQFFTLSMILQLKQLHFSLDRIRSYSNAKDIGCLTENLLAEKEMIEEEIKNLIELSDRTDRLLKRLSFVGENKKHIDAAEYDCRIVSKPDRIQYEISLNFEIRDLYQYIKLMYESYIRSPFASKLTTHGEIVLKIHQENLEQKQFRIYNSIGFFLNTLTEQPTGRGITKISGGSFASCLHVGAYDTIHRSYQRLYEYIQHQGLTISGDSLEFSIINISLTDNPADFLTEIQIPVS